MDYLSTIQRGDDVYVAAVKNFSLGQILDCGQCFRWNREADGAYIGIAHGRLLRVRHEGDGLLLESTTQRDFQDIWCGYFDLGRDYGDVKRLMDGDATLVEAARYSPGMRVLRQDAWEALCCFIISQNNNIGRIRGIVQRLCEGFGAAIEGGFAFPTPERLAGCEPDDLAEIRSGFRAKYIISAARAVHSGSVQLHALADMDGETVLEALQTISGVGPKVARCAMLYGLGMADCVPMDVWMKRVLALHFPDGLPAAVLPVAGLVQQYLFHYIRHHYERTA